MSILIAIAPLFLAGGGRIVREKERLFFAPMQEKTALRPRRKGRFR
jgi:hypothetical protein